MARVVFLAEHRRHTGGAGTLEVPARNFRDAVAAIGAAFPGFPLADIERCTVAIDGEIVPRPLLEPLSPDSEVVFVGRIGAG